MNSQQTITDGASRLSCAAGFSWLLALLVLELSLAVVLQIGEHDRRSSVHGEPVTTKFGEIVAGLHAIWKSPSDMLGDFWYLLQSAAPYGLAIMLARPMEFGIAATILLILPFIFVIGPMLPGGGWHDRDRKGCTACFGVAIAML